MMLEISRAAVVLFIFFFSAVASGIYIASKVNKTSEAYKVCSEAYKVCSEESTGSNE